jgi:hypothetical protein
LTCVQNFGGKISPFWWKIFWKKKFLFENPFFKEILTKIATVTCNIIECLRFLPFIFLISRYLAKYIYGWSPLQQHHKIEEKNHWLWGIQFIDIFCRYCFMLKRSDTLNPIRHFKIWDSLKTNALQWLFFLCWFFLLFCKKEIEENLEKCVLQCKILFFNKKMQLLRNEKIRDKNINAYITVSSMSFLLAPLVISYKYTINWRQLSKL